MGLQKTVLPKDVSDQLTTEEELEAALREMAGSDADDGKVAPATTDIKLEAAATADTEQERAAADFENQQADNTFHWFVQRIQHGHRCRSQGNS